LGKEIRVEFGFEVKKIIPEPIGQNKVSFVEKGRRRTEIKEKRGIGGEG